jgi:arylsulfatase
LFRRRSSAHFQQEHDTHEQKQPGKGGNGHNGHRKVTVPAGFKGVIELDIRDSKPDWAPYLPPRAPKDAPNVLFILYDDTGLAAWSPYGGRINMPVLQKLADDGLTYTQWHTTALCSPSRSCMLTGRNHHVNGMAAITEGTNGFPGAHGRIPAACATIGQVLQDAGWSTFWLGKEHNVPEQDLAAGGSREQWPLQKGFDRFYGFLGGETNNWSPNLVEDNHYVDQPSLPEEGYHLSKDLADKAIQMIGDQKTGNQSKPWYLWFCPGANHAPHHAPKEYIEKYKGKFDDGYEAYREWVLKRMIDKGGRPREAGDRQAGRSPGLLCGRPRGSHRASASCSEGSSGGSPRPRTTRPTLRGRAAGEHRNPSLPGGAARELPRRDGRTPRGARRTR